MIIKTHILRCDQCLHQRRRQLGIVNHNAVFPIVVPSTYNLTVGRIDLCGIAANRILQILNGRHITNPALVDRINSRCGRDHRHC